MIAPQTVTDEEHAFAERVSRYCRYQPTAEDVAVLVDAGYLIAPRVGRHKLTVKALRLMAKTTPNSWYCSRHGLNGCDGKPRKNAGCTCPHRQG